MAHQLKTLANPFQFSDPDICTATDEHSEIRFCAKDVYAALDIAWSSMTLGNMPENRFMVTNLITIKDERNAHFINEAGPYRLIFRSNNPKSKAFANWVCETVLPNIRKTGLFGTIGIKNRSSISRQIDSISLQIVKNNNAFRRKLLQGQLRRLCIIVNQLVAPGDWIAKDWNPVDLLNSAPAKLS